MKKLLFPLFLVLAACGSKGGSSPSSASSAVGVYDGSFKLQSTTCATKPVATMSIADNVATYPISYGLAACNMTASTTFLTSGTVGNTSINCDTSASCQAALTQAQLGCSSAPQAPQGQPSTVTIVAGTLTINNVAGSCTSVYSQQ